MSDKKWSDATIPVASSASDSDYTLIVQGGVSKTATIGKIRDLIASHITDATTTGRAVLSVANPGAVRFLRINADNTVTLLDAASFAVAINSITSTGAGEIVAIADKSTPVSADHLLIEDSASGNSKKDITIGALATSLEGIMSLQNLQGAVTDAQVPNNITVDLATTATTALTGDSATAFFSTGQIERARGGTGADTSGYGNGLIGSDVSNNTINVNTLAKLQTAIGDTILAGSRTLTINGTTNEVSVSGGTEDLTADRSWAVGLPSIISLTGKTLNLPSSDANPGTTAGQIKHDTVITELTGGALKWYDGTSVRILVDLDAAPTTDAYIVAYDGTNKKFYMKVDATGAGGSDATAIHNNVNSEISAIASKTTPISADYLLIEDTAASNAKKKITAGSLATALEGVMSLQNMQGAVTDAQVPNSITVDLASQATTLQNARTIGGVSFNGSANIVPQTIQVVDSTDATSFIAMFDDATGSIQPKTDAGLTYNASTGTLSATYGPLPRSYLAGLGLANNVSDAVNDIDIAVGECKDSTSAKDLRLTSVITKRLDAAWAVGTNQGGLDTGSIANTTYHVWLIMRSDTGVVDALFSTSATAPTMPTNYDYKRRIGSIVRISAAIKTFTQRGNQVLWKSAVIDVSGGTVGTTASLYTLTVPSGIQVDAIVTVDCAKAAASPAVLITSPDQDDVAVSPTYTIFGNSGAYGQTVLECRTNTSGQIRARSDTASVTIDIVTHGYIDTRGRDN